MFVWAHATHSCATPTPSPHPGFQHGVPVSWWIILIADVGMILCVALVTLPLYSLLAHTAQLSASVVRLERRALAAAARAAAGGGAGDSKHR